MRGAQGGTSGDSTATGGTPDSASEAGKANGGGATGTSDDASTVMDGPIDVSLADHVAAKGDVAEGGSASSEDGTTDGASSDGARADGSSSSGCPDPAVVCDDFEASNLSEWNVLETGGTFAIDQMHAYGGKSSVRLTIPAKQRGGFLEKMGSPLFPLVNNTSWGRMMVFFESMASLHFDTIRGAPVGGGTPWYNVGGQYKALLFNYYSGDKDCAGYPKPNPGIPTNKWMCWEWKFDGSKNELDLWIDGTLIYTVLGTGSTCVTGGAPMWAAPTFGSIRIGEYNAQTEAVQTRMWMDDVALGSTGRIVCPVTSPSAH
jgi:hypothetical protein